MYKTIGIYHVAWERLPVWARKPVLILETEYRERQSLHFSIVKRSAFPNDVSDEMHVLQITYSPMKKKNQNIF
jgi:hypothetical protein